MMLKVYKGLIAVLLLGGCYSQFKATKDVNKALANYPQIVAKIAQDSFPCDVIRIDTNISVSNYDTTLLIDCPVRDTISVHDTVLNSVLKKVKLQYKTIYVTKFLESTAKLTILNARLDSLTKVTTSIQKSNDDLTSKVGRKNKVIYWLIALLIGFSIPYLIKLIKILDI
jgi:hypothetical protein